MTVSQIKEALINQIKEVEDENLLKLFYDMLKVYDSKNEEVSIIGYDAHGKAKTADEVKESLAKELKSAKEGKYISLSQLKSRSEKWLNSSK